MRKRLISLVLALSFIFSGCATNSAETVETQSYMSYLGDYGYDEDASALVLEPIEDEYDEDGNQYMGIQYRTITDLDGLLSRTDTPILIYFYSSMSSDTYGITAAVEDIAQCLWGDVLVLALDSLSYKDLVQAYEISGIPEFVLIENGAHTSSFGSSGYEYWNTDDVVAWLEECGYTLDYSKLE